MKISYMNPSKRICMIVRNLLCKYMNSHHDMCYCMRKHNLLHNLRCRKSCKFLDMPLCTSYSNALCKRSYNPCSLHRYQ